MGENIDIVTGRLKTIQSLINIFPKSLRLQFNPRRFAIEMFVMESAKILPKGTKMLDAGAGPCPYKHFFKHCNYEATDFTNHYRLMDFVCTLDKIPKKPNTYDVILSTEVLEHVEYPQKVINEFYRILKPKGKLFLTVPQGWMMHQKPYNYYYFTYFGLESLLKNSGFRKFTITPKGGYFWHLADTIKFNSILEQFKNNKLLYYSLKIFEFPFTQILIPFVLFHLDKIDKVRDWTIGYTVVAEK
jgi:SAM-dependent methyltransferase